MAAFWSRVRNAWLLQWGPVVVTGISRRAGGHRGQGDDASMGSGRGDRNQPGCQHCPAAMNELQWGPVVVTGISYPFHTWDVEQRYTLQWGPVVVTGISCRPFLVRRHPLRFNGVRSW